MRHSFAQSWKNIFRLLARQPEIESVRAKIEFAGPFQSAGLGDSDFLKNPITIPRFEHTAPSHIAEIDNAGNVVIEAEKQFVILQRFSFRDLHTENLHQKDSLRKHGYHVRPKNDGANDRSSNSQGA